MCLYGSKHWMHGWMYHVSTDLHSFGFISRKHLLRANWSWNSGRIKAVVSLEYLLMIYQWRCYKISLSHKEFPFQQFSPQFVCFIGKTSLKSDFNSQIVKTVWVFLLFLVFLGRLVICYWVLSFCFVFWLNFLNYKLLLPKRSWLVVHWQSAFSGFFLSGTIWTVFTGRSIQTRLFVEFTKSEVNFLDFYWSKKENSRQSKSFATHSIRFWCIDHGG